MPIPLRLDYVIEKTLKAQETNEQRRLRELTGIKLSASEAQVAWERVREHKWYVSERLGRDVGLRVAAVDYLENIMPPRIASTAHSSISKWWYQVARPLLIGA